MFSDLFEKFVWTALSASLFFLNNLGNVVQLCFGFLWIMNECIVSSITRLNLSRTYSFNCLSYVI